MKKLLWAALLLVAVQDGIAADRTIVAPFETEAQTVSPTRLDTIVVASQRKRGVEPAPACSDAVFCRRVYLDVIGTLPEPAEVTRFLVDNRNGKRAALVESLLARDEFADYWSLKWCDALRVKSEFPINLWPNAVQAYHRWVRAAIHDNVPYDRFARDLLTSSGSNFRVPPVNFYRATQGRDPQSLASAVALTFMGERAEKWPAERRAAMAKFFSRVAYKKTGEWKEEIVFQDPAPGAEIAAVFPDGTSVTIPADQDPRVVFADWLIEPMNHWFARTVVNRMWAWLMGRGIVHEPDDFRADNPPSIPELLTYLEKELVDAKYDLRHIYRLILNSRTYQQSPIPRSDLAKAEPAFACYPVRRLDAEVLVDALGWISGKGEGYTSVIPEPYTFVPEENRTITLADGSISSPFLDMFGRPARDTGLASERSSNPTDAQRLFLLNSSDVQRRLERSPRLIALFDKHRGDAEELVTQVYLLLLSRAPTQAEIDAVIAYAKSPGRSPREAGADLAWSLVNSKEFLYRH
ncbi:MAG: DUF1549 and DUF1553 domain-containing protein [Planctomycetes bacterium]|nr:DUF1549 and DUF1553 domain-containing protein [Planctomycetota bacterium]